MDFEICEACGEEFEFDDTEGAENEILCPACSSLLEEENLDDLDFFFPDEDDDFDDEDEEDQAHGWKQEVKFVRNL